VLEGELAAAATLATRSEQDDIAVARDASGALRTARRRVAIVALAATARDKAGAFGCCRSYLRIRKRG
jgi:hypothetical protein